MGGGGDRIYFYDGYSGVSVTHYLHSIVITTQRGVLLGSDTSGVTP